MTAVRAYQFDFSAFGVLADYVKTGAMKTAPRTPIGQAKKNFRGPFDKSGLKTYQKKRKN
jgi:hypothetical protein